MDTTSDRPSGAGRDRSSDQIRDLAEDPPAKGLDTMKAASDALERDGAAGGAKDDDRRAETDDRLPGTATSPRVEGDESVMPRLKPR